MEQKIFSEMLHTQQTIPNKLYTTKNSPSRDFSLFVSPLPPQTNCCHRWLIVVFSNNIFCLKLVAFLLYFCCCIDSEFRIKFPIWGSKKKRKKKKIVFGVCFMKERFCHIIFGITRIFNDFQCKSNKRRCCLTHFQNCNLIWEKKSVFWKMFCRKHAIFRKMFLSKQTERIIK